MLRSSVTLFESIVLLYRVVWSTLSVHIARIGVSIALHQLGGFTEIGAYVPIFSPETNTL